MSTQTAADVGLFPVSYRIGNEMPGAPILTVHLLVSTPDKSINGRGIVTQAISPPLREPTSLEGDYTYMTVMPNNSTLLVTALGVGPIGDTPQVIARNVRLRMILSKDWKSGTANYDYFWNNKWHSIDNVPVKLIQPAIPEQS